MENKMKVMNFDNISNHDKVTFFITKFYDTEDEPHSKKWLMANHYGIANDIKLTMNKKYNILKCKNIMRTIFFTQGNYDFSELNNIILSRKEIAIIMYYISHEYENIYMQKVILEIGTKVLNFLKINYKDFIEVQKDLIELDEILDKHEIQYKEWYEKKFKQSFLY